MRKLILGLAGVGVVMALRPVLKRRMVKKMREHCRQMMGQSATGSETSGGETKSPEAMCQKMREHCGPMASQREQQDEPVGAV